MRIIIAGALAVAACALTVAGANARAVLALGGRSPARRFSAAVRDSARRLDANRINLFAWNSGQFAWDPGTFGGGMFFPKGTDRTVVFASGLWLGARVGGGLRVALAEYASEYGPGPMVGGVADDPTRPQHRVYKVARWTGNPADSAHVTRSAAELAADPTLDPLAHHAWSEYIAGAAPYGAPTRTWRLPLTATPDPTDSVDVPGPDVVGDQMLWCVYNDADPAGHVHHAGGTAPLGVEIQRTIFAFDGDESLRNTVFLRFRLINKGANALDSVYAALWSDPDVGSASDDVVGCDTTRSLGFAYNALAVDGVYGDRPPAVGYALLRGPVDRVSGDTLGLTSFDRYVGGTDPGSSVESYRHMRGLLPDGGVIIDPTTGRPTRFFHAGDPVRGTGWLDANPADRKMIVSSGPFAMARGDTQEIVVALIVGQGAEHLASVGVLRCEADRARRLYELGFDRSGLAPAAPCSTSVAYTVTNCPRSPAFWSAECALARAQIPGGLLSVGQLAEIAACVDSFSTLFDWPPGTDLAGFSAVVDPAGTLDVRQQAKRAYAVLMANRCAGRMGVYTNLAEPIWLNPLTRVACSALRARTIGELAEPAVVLPQFLDAAYANDGPAHPRALAGIDVGLPAFDGGAGPAAGFLGSSLDPVVDAAQFSSAEFRFDRAVTQKAYRYLRLERQSDGTAPPQGRGYLYAGFVAAPFTCWDADGGLQLDAAFVERVLTDDAGTILPRASQPATFDSTWAPDTSASGGHEYLFAFRRTYQPTPRAELAQDGVVADGSAPVMYALASRLRGSTDVIDDGDRFRFSWGRPASPGPDSLLIALEGQPLDNRAVEDVYRDLIACLEPIDDGVGIGVVCTGTKSEAVTVVGAETDSGRVIVTWYSITTPLTFSVERRFEDGPWNALGVVIAGPDGLIIYDDHDVVAGGRYDYRLAFDSGGRLEYFGQVRVDVPGRSRFAFFGARPNPATQDLVLSFSLPSREPARLDLLDVAGRRVLSRDLVGLGAGPQVYGLGSSDGLRAGIYLVRITQGGRRISGKVAIVH